MTTTEAKDHGRDNDFLSDLTEVPVIEVTKDNVSRLSPVIKKAILEADIIAVDCELSGLGDRKKLRATDMKERYINLCKVAMTRSIISMGISVFKQKPDDATSFTVQTFNVMVLCQEDYIVEPASLQFLVHHGFDFAKQYSKGVPYYRGNDRADIGEGSISWRREARDIFGWIVKAGQTSRLVFHNGLVDLVFLYQNFYAQLPQSLNSFIADIHQMFPGGICDTKYMADYVIRMSASFLEYMFKTLQIKNSERATIKQSHLKLKFKTETEVNCDKPATDGKSSFSTEIEYRDCTIRLPSDDQVFNICETYSHHGHCPDGHECPKSHDINLIVAHKHRKKKRKRDASVEANDDTNKGDKKSVINGTDKDHWLTRISGAIKDASHKPHDSKEVGSNAEKADAGNAKSDAAEESGDGGGGSGDRVVTTGGHRAGFDAFMTGYSYLAFLASRWHSSNEKKQSTGNDVTEKVVTSSPADSELRNKIHLVYKTTPLLIFKSNFAKISAAHAQKHQTLLSENPSVTKE